MTSYSISYFSALVTSIGIVFFKVMILHPVSFHYISFLCVQTPVCYSRRQEGLSYPKSIFCMEHPLWGRCVNVPQQQYFKSVFMWTALQLCNWLNRFVCGCWSGSLLTARSNLSMRNAARASGYLVYTQTVETQPIGDRGQTAGWGCAGSPTSSHLVISKQQPEMKTAGPGFTSGDRDPARL